MLLSLKSMLLFLLAFFVAEVREWTSSNGKFKVEAEFVAIKDGKVVLEKEDGTFLSVPLSRLCEEDIAFIESETGEEIDVPMEGSDTKASANEKPNVIKLKGVKEGGPAEEVRNLGTQTWATNSLAFSGDGSILVSGKMDEYVCVFDVNEGTRKGMTDQLSQVGAVDAIAISADGKKVAAGGNRGLVMIWNLSKGGELKEAGNFVGHSAGIESLAISPDGKYGLSGSADKSARYWDLETGEQIAAFEDFSERVNAVWFSEDSTKAMASDGISVCKINLKTKKGEMIRLRSSGYGQFVAFSPDGKYIAANESYDVIIWDLTRSAKETRLKGSEIQWTGAFTADSKRLVTGVNGIVNVWDVEKQARVGAITIKEGNYVQTLATSPDPQYISAISSLSTADLRVFKLPPQK